MRRLVRAVSPAATEARAPEPARSLPLRGIARRGARADLPRMRLGLLAAAALLGGSTPTLTGTVTTNTGASITVTAGDRSLTCAVPGAKAQQAIARWGTGARVAIGCRTVDGKLVLARLARLGTKEGDRPAATPPPAPPTTQTETQTEPQRTATAPPPPAQDRRDARGVVVLLTGDGVGLKPDAGGELVRCAITRAPDSQAAATKLAPGAHVAITCRLDGGRYVLAAVSPIS